MRLAALAFAIVATVVPAPQVDAAAGTQRLVASAGWQLEFFGQDVAVLRTALTAPASGRSGQILMSCEGTVRRLRITMPDAVPRRSATDTGGLAMIKGHGGANPGLLAAISRFVLERDRILTFVDGSRGDATLQLARLLAGQPTRLELLVHHGQSPITIGRVLAYSIATPLDRADAIAFAGFIAACTNKSG